MLATPDAFCPSSRPWPTRHDPVTSERRRDFVRKSHTGDTRRLLSVFADGRRGTIPLYTGDRAPID
jgi:hypothetical protein